MVSSLGEKQSRNQANYCEASLPVGSQHKKQRKMLNPAFSVANLRKLTPIFYELTHEVRLAD